MGETEYNALQCLIQKLDDLVIKEADKGSGVVVMSKDFYELKIAELLSDPIYEATNIDCTGLVKRVKSFTNQHKTKLTKREYEAVIKQESYLASFYGLPKIHKSQLIKTATNSQQSEIITCPEPEDLKFRPIVSCRDCPTRSLCDLLDKLLRPFVNKVKFRIKDTWDFLRKLKMDANEGDITITADISSLYTNITTSKGEEAISYYYDLYPSLLPQRFTKQFLLDLYNFCQENLFFRHNGIIYRQTSGTGMGRIYAPSLADLKQGYDEVILEERIRANFSETVVSYFLDNYGRYLDDIHFRFNIQFSVELQSIKAIMNSVDPNINYEFESSQDSDNNSNPFLEVRIIITGNHVITDLFAKNTDTFNYVPFNSSHPRHTIRNIPFSLARRVRGIVSDTTLLPIRMNEMKSRLKNKKYPVKLVDEAIRLAMAIPREQILNPVPKSQENKKSDIFFVSTYNTSITDPIKEIRHAIEGFNSSHDDSNRKINIKSSYRRGPSLKDLLMFKRSAPTGVTGCKDGCLLCNKFLHTENSIVLKNGITLKANEKFECSSRNLLYVLKCKCCGENYLGETGDELCSRCTVHRQQGKEGAQIQAVKADQHLRICGKDDYLVFPFKRLKKNCTIYRRVVEDDFIKKTKPALNGKSIFPSPFLSNFNPSQFK